jgi:hypothetical protein
MGFGWHVAEREVWGRGRHATPRTALQTYVIVPPTRGQVQPAGLEMNGHLFEREQRNGNTLQLELMNAVGRANATSFSADRTAKTEDQ